MRVGGVPYRAIFTTGDGTEVRVIDQTVLPHRFETIRLRRPRRRRARHPRDGRSRAPPLIGATAAYGVALAMTADPSDDSLDRTLAVLGATRPTAVNLRWALDAAGALLRELPHGERAGRGVRLRGPALRGGRAHQPQHRRIRARDLPRDRAAKAGAGGGRRSHAERHDPLQRGLARHGGLGHRHRAHVPGPRRGPSRARLGSGDATPPPGRGPHLVGARQARRPAHAGVRRRGRPPDEPRQGRSGHRGDRPDHGPPATSPTRSGPTLLPSPPATTASPFYVAAPSPSIDWTIEDGASIPIEQRDPDEVTRIWGVDEDGVERRVRVVPEGTPGRELRLRRDAEAARHGPWSPSGACARRIAARWGRCSGGSCRLPQKARLRVGHRGRVDDAAGQAARCRRPATGPGAP